MKQKSFTTKSLPLLHTIIKTTITLQIKSLTCYLLYNPTITIVKIPKNSYPNSIISIKKSENKLMRNFIFKISNELKKKNLLNLNKKQKTNRIKNKMKNQNKKEKKSY